MVDKAAVGGGRVRDRLRGDPQQLLPAGDAGADGGLRRDLGVRPRGPPLPRLRLRRPRASRPRRPSWPRCSSASSGSATRPSSTPARTRSRSHMRELYPDWRAKGLTACLHERAGGFAFNRESMLGLADKARAAGARIVEGVEVTGFEFDGSGAAIGGRDERGDDRGRAGGDRGRPVDRRGCGSCSAFPTGSTSAIPTARSSATPRCGPTGTSRRARSRWRPRRSTPPTGARRPSFTSTPTGPLRDDDGAAGQRGALGHLRQARPRDGPGRRPAAAAGPRDRARPVPDRHRRARLPGPVVRGALALHRAVRGLPPKLRARRARAGRAPSPPTTSRSSTACATTSTSPPTRTTATR